MSVDFLHILESMGVQARMYRYTDCPHFFMKSKNFMQRRSIILFLMFSLCASVVHAESPDPCIDGTLKHGFSVSAYKKVLFAPGNLQYNAVAGSHLCIDGTIKPGTWRFAEHQWDLADEKSNRNKSEFNDAWIDLFAWGTSGWNSGATYFNPWENSRATWDYYINGDPANSMTGEYRNADWAIYNTIGDDAPGTWRTLTAYEWSYIINMRRDASQLRGIASIGDVHGLVLLPDDYDQSDVSLPAFTPQPYSVNSYDINEWLKLESIGAVFLPAEGVMYGTWINRPNYYGYYWSTTPMGSNIPELAGALEFSEISTATISSTARDAQIPVRPVRETPPVSKQEQDTTVCDTLMPITWQGHEWTSDGTVVDTVKDICGYDSLIVLLTLNTEICCQEIITINQDTAVCDTLMPFTWRGVLFAEEGERRWIDKNARDCDSIEYIYTLSTFHCERLYDFIVNKYNWQLLCNNERVRQLFPELTVSGYQWYKDGTAIPDATEDNFSEQNELQGAFQLRLQMDNGRYVWSEILTIQPAQTQATSRIRIYNHNGYLFYQAEGDTTIPVLPKGLYFIQIEQNGEQRTEKKLIP